MHARGGFDQEGMLQRSWSIVVDLVCLAIVVWIATGLYMWWGVPVPAAEVLSLAAGVSSFLVFTQGL